MSEFEQLVIHSHQVFFALVVFAFASILYFDLDELKESTSQGMRGFVISIFLTILCGVFFILYTTWGNDGFFFAVEFSLLVVFSLIHPKFAVSFLIYLLLSRPWESIDDQMMSSMARDGSILTLLSVIAHKIIKKQLYFRFNLGTFFLIGFAIWVFLSGFFSHHVTEAMIQYNEIFSKGVILFILIQNSLEKDKDLLPVKAVFVLAILEKCFVSFYKSHFIASNPLEDANERLESIGILSNSNDIAAIFVLAIPFTIYFILKSDLKPFNWFGSVIALSIMSFLVWESQSRGALLGLFAIFGAYALVRIKNTKLLALMIAFGLVATLGSFKLMNRDSADVEGSTSNRIIFWKAGMNMAVKNPIFGVGFWGFPQNLPAYAPDGNTGSEKEHMTAHSTWVLALGENGFMALFLFLGLWGYAAFCAWKIRSVQPEYFLAIAGYGMTITFLSHTYLLYPYILLALAITHAKILLAKQKTSTADLMLS